MAVSPIVPLVPVDEYPESSYRPEMEYVDGFLVERGMPTIAHGLLQMILGSHFRLFRQQFRFAVISEARTQIVERADTASPTSSSAHCLCPLERS